MEVDTYWIINRICAGDSNSFQFAFYVENIKVNPEFPSLMAKIHFLVNMNMQKSP
ncbi:hypothetical protein [Mesomycoplasma hyopneumoniae]|uniref:hypothetical protein n=1 Tax=Mesomycoplasma hyopneumoniae TaxID=2099 RepID=UPI00215DA1A1|nr:hypothetical protein [Mesomycoplasma hyopneumoniae]